MSDDWFDRNCNRIANECYLISKGVRSCSSETVAAHGHDDGDIDRALLEYRRVVTSHGLYCVWFEFPRDEDDAPDAHYFEFWIYSYHHQLPVINALKSAPKSFFSEWAMGKLLGYSDASMEKYLSHHVMSGLNVNTELLKEED